MLPHHSIFISYNFESRGGVRTKRIPHKLNPSSHFHAILNKMHDIGPNEANWHHDDIENDLFMTLSLETNQQATSQNYQNVI